jgi:hypothetical protein
MVRKISILSSYAFLMMVPSGALFHFYFNETIGAYQITILDFILWMAFATFAMDICLTKRSLLQQAVDKWMLLLFCTCMFFFVIGLINRNEHVLTWGLRHTWTLLLLYFPLSHFAGSSQEHKEHLIKFLLVYSTILGILTIPLRLGLLAPIVDPVWQAGPVREFPGTDPVYGSHYRIAWVCRPTYVDIALCFCLAILSLRGSLLRLAGGKVGWLLCIMANIILLIIAKSRLTVLLSVSTVALCGSLLWFYGRRHSGVGVYLTMFVIICLAVVMLSAFFLQEDILYFTERISSLSARDRTVQMRMLTAEKDIQDFLESPIIGKGLGFSDWFYYRTDAMWRRTYGEIGITRLLTWFGLAGTAVVYSVLVWLLLRSLRLLKHSDSSLEKATGAVCAAIIVALMGSGFVFTENAVPLILIAVLLRKPVTAKIQKEKHLGTSAL